MKRLVIALAVGATILSGCSAPAQTGGAGFSEHVVGGTRCIVYQPYTGSGNGISMQCDFRSAR